ncbi:DUF3800 domain-containing protein [Agrobacterium salinitolerans]|uniref:DUF3800 domain-containing protein n=1 Tax=Agrobacterium salinitolerans TaxID=1183413 RepID=UPI0020B2390E|nr:DUF3800 domain-containing protein [Agrobacterium salinitolerans]
MFRHVGHPGGQLRNFAEVPLFLASKASRLFQMADLIAYWIFRHFQSGDQRSYNLIRPYFARYGVGPVSGLRCHGRARDISAPRISSQSNSPISKCNAERYCRSYTPNFHA